MQAQYNIFIGGVFQKEAAKLFPTAPYSVRTKEEGNAQWCIMHGCQEA
jgi:hypothetical protein